MIGELALQALTEINGLLKTKAVSNNKLNQARVDHTTDMAPFYVSVIFNEKCFKKIMKLAETTSKSFTETGTFFYGRVKDNSLIIEGYASDFELANDNCFDVSVNITKRNILEKVILTEKTKKNPNPYNVVVHFHTHPSYGINDKNEVFKTKTTRYSDQDLYTIGYLQKYHQPSSDNIVIYTGGLLAADDARIQLSMIYYDVARKDFYNIKNIYYMSNGQFYKFNNYDISKNEELDETNTIKLQKTLGELK
jgi:hypothetical protein